MLEVPDLSATGTIMDIDNPEGYQAKFQGKQHI